MKVVVQHVVWSAFSQSIKCDKFGDWSFNSFRKWMAKLLLWTWTMPFFTLSLSKGDHAPYILKHIVTKYKCDKISNCSFNSSWGKWQSIFYLWPWPFWPWPCVKITMPHIFGTTLSQSNFVPNLVTLALTNSEKNDKVFFSTFDLDFFYLDLEWRSQCHSYSEGHCRKVPLCQIWWL